jgi:5-methylcytosine-specific restriction endonuclease McrA
MPGSFCTICHRRIPSGSRCAQHAMRSPSSHNARTARWIREIRPKALARAGFRCERCGATVLLEVHHVDEDPTNNRASNLRVLCQDCHHDTHNEKERQLGLLRSPQT